MKKRLTVLALAFAMVLTMSASVFAAGDGANTGKTGGADSYAPGSAKLVKYAQIPEGVDLTKEAMANKTFSFHFAATDPTAPATTKNYAVPKADFSAKDFTITSEKLSVAEKWTSAGVDETQNKVWSKPISEIFANYEFPRAGEYTFTVTETTNTGAALTDADNWTYAKDSYTLRLVVKNDPTTDDPDKKTITDVTVENDEGKKVDPTDVTPGDNPDDPDTGDVIEPDPTDSNGGFTFTNLYKPTVTKHDEPKQPNPDPNPENPQNPGDIAKDEPNLKEDNGAFELDKFVLGEYGDQTADWNFPVTVTLPKSDPKFNVVKSGNLTGGALTKDADNERVYTGTITLKHNGTFVIGELPVGTKIKVAENGPVTGYTQLMDTKDADEGDATLEAGYTITVTEDGGYAICRNSFDDTSITPTGIIINNLPYVLLIGIALGGIVLFSRKRRYE